MLFVFNGEKGSGTNTITTRICYLNGGKSIVMAYENVGYDTLPLIKGYVPAINTKTLYNKALQICDTIYDTSKDVIERYNGGLKLDMILEQVKDKVFQNSVYDPSFVYDNCVERVLSTLDGYTAIYDNDYGKYFCLPILNACRDWYKRNYGIDLNANNDSFYYKLYNQNLEYVQKKEFKQQDKEQNNNCRYVANIVYDGYVPVFAPLGDEIDEEKFREDFKKQKAKTLNDEVSDIGIAIMRLNQDGSADIIEEKTVYTKKELNEWLTDWWHIYIIKHKKDWVNGGIMDTTYMCSDVIAPLKVLCWDIVCDMLNNNDELRSNITPNEIKKMCLDTTMEFKYSISSYVTFYLQELTDEFNNMMKEETENRNDRYNKKFNDTVKSYF